MVLKNMLHIVQICCTCLMFNKTIYQFNIPLYMTHAFKNHVIWILYLIRHLKKNQLSSVTEFDGEPIIPEINTLLWFIHKNHLKRIHSMLAK